MIPASAGPATLPSRAREFEQRVGLLQAAPGTICGTIAVEAGLKKAVAAPSTA